MGSETGICICEVTDIKRARGEKFAIANEGMQHYLANSGNYAQVIRRNFSFVLANKMQSKATDIADICGPLCTPLDVIATKLKVP